MKTYISPEPKATIQTVEGTAVYVYTETENNDGRWNDRWNNNHGFYIIHKGRNHHIYHVVKNTLQ